MERFFWLPDTRQGNRVYIKRKEKGRDVVYYVTGSDCKSGGHKVYVRRMSRVERPHWAAKAYLIPMETFFTSPPVVQWDE